MSYKVGVICHNPPMHFEVFNDLPNDAQILWFNEIESCFSYLLYDSLDKIIVNDFLCRYDAYFYKYKDLIKQMHPHMQMNACSFAYLENTNKKIITKLFPKLDILFQKGQLEPVFQPILKNDHKEIKILGFECLSRITFDGENYPPDFVFSYAQEKFELRHYDMFCLKKALELAPNKPDRLIFVNVRPASLLDNDFVPWLCDLLAKNNKSSSQIVIEVTEQYCIFAEQKMKEICQALKNKGFNLAIDDFGSGISNLSLLEIMRPNFIKISGNLVNHITKDEFKKKIVKAILDFSKFLNIDVIVENIEEEAQWLLLKSLGVQYAQGFLFSKPLPLEEITKVI